jgi:hypothetical protein
MVNFTAETQGALDSFKAEVTEIFELFNKKIAAKPVPRFIYHYTNDMGFKGIIETGTLRFTNIFNLNDPSELRHGFGLAIKVMKDRANGGPSEWGQFSNDFALFESDFIEMVLLYFVCCFSETSDDLGQWRAYADDGKGFAIGFDTVILEKAFSHLAPQNHFSFPITYNDLDLIRLHSAIIDNMVNLISWPFERNFDDSTKRLYLVDLWRLTTLYCVRAAIYFKHQAYSNETEYRFLQMHYGLPHVPPEVKYRTRPYELIRFREFEWRKVALGALTKVIVGPAADQARATLFARECLRAYHPSMAEIEVVPSKIPYRR